MSRKIIYTISFLDSLYEIQKYIQKDSNKRAKDFVNFIKSKLDNLKLFPKRGRYVENEMYIYQLHENYYLSYFVKEENIYLLYVGHVKFRIKK